MKSPPSFRLDSTGMELLQQAPEDTMSYPTVNQQPASLPPLGDRSVRVGCPQCGKLVGSQISHQRGVFTYMSSLAIGSLGGSLCCLCLIPCCGEDWQDVVHRCPSCDGYLGTYKR